MSGHVDLHGERVHAVSVDGDTLVTAAVRRQPLRYSQRAVGEHQRPGGVGRVADEEPGEDPVDLHIRGGGGLARRAMGSEGRL